MQLFSDEKNFILFPIFSLLWTFWKFFLFHLGFKTVHRGYQKL